MGNLWIWIWLAVVIVTLVIELLTVGLTSIWLTGGGLVALVIALLHGPVWLQIVAFFTVSFLLIYFTRPWAVRAIDSKRIKTNYEELLEKEVRILERVDNQQGTGKALYNGMEWSAKAAENDDIFEPEEIAVVSGISGVKLILKKHINHNI